MTTQILKQKQATRAGSAGARAQAMKQQMSDMLSGTTELTALQQRLLSSLTKGMGVDGLRYQHTALDVDIQLGSQASHRCDYRLLSTNEYLGDISFSRDRRFTEKELQLIESVIPALVRPLRTSLQNTLGLNLPSDSILNTKR